MTMAWPAAAQAADYAGGTAPETTRKASNQLTLVGIRTEADGSALVSVKVSTPCYAAIGERPVQLAADGTFSLDFRVRGRVRELNPRFRQRTRIRMSGQVAGASGAGTVLVNARLLRGGRTVQRCNPARQDVAGARRRRRAGRRRCPRRRVLPRPHESGDRPPAGLRPARRPARAARPHRVLRVPPALRRRPLLVGERHARRQDRRRRDASSCARRSPTAGRTGPSATASGSTGASPPTA